MPSRWMRFGPFPMAEPTRWHQSESARGSGLEFEEDRDT